MKPQAIQKTEIRSEMQLDQIDLHLEKLLGYSVQYVKTKDRCTYLVIFVDGKQPQPCDYGHQKTYGQLRQLADGINRIRDHITGIEFSDQTVAERQIMKIAAGVLPPL